MFPDKKKAALLILAHGKGEEDAEVDGAPEQEADDASIAAEDLIAAVTEGDPGAVVTAMRAIFDSFQSGDGGEEMDAEEEAPPPFARGGKVKGSC